MITQEASLGRKARRRRFTFQQVNDLTREVAALRGKLEVSENALRACEGAASALQADLTDQLVQMQMHAANLEADLMDRRLEAERLDATNRTLAQELEQVKVQKEILRHDYERLAAELKTLKIERARNDIETWRAASNHTAWQRCYHKIEGFFRKERDDNPSIGFDTLLRLPPPS